MRAARFLHTLFRGNDEYLQTRPIFFTRSEAGIQKWPSVIVGVSYHGIAATDSRFRGNDEEQ